GVMEEAIFLNGDNAYNAHFGECISAIGDIDDDGYQDVAIGAPKEDDFAGAVYIYHGDANGIVSKYSMRLSGRSINPTIQMFGQSISGNVDMDGNEYPDVTIGAFMADTVVLLRSKPVITVDTTIFLPASINITVPQCHEGPQHLNCFNVTICMRFRGKFVPGQIELLYNLTADADKRYKGLSSRVYFTHGGEQTGAVSHSFNLSVSQLECHHYTAYVRKEVKDVFAAITFEASYSLGKHVLDVHRKHELASLSPVLRWKKGEKIAARNETWFEKNCLSDDCAADLKLHGKLLLSGHHIRPHLALGGVKNVSLNITIVNAGDDAYDTNIYLNFSREVHYINFLQREEKGISCELIQLDFLKCSVGFPFMRAQTKYHLSVLFDTSHLSGENETLIFLVHAKSANPEHENKLHDNTLELSIPLMHEVDTAVTGVVTPSSFQYGNSVDSSRFVHLEDLECNFQPLNFTFHVINNGPSRLPGSTVDIRLPNRLVGNGADMFLILDTQVAEGKGNCTWQRNPTPCIIPQDRESIFHAIFAFFSKSGRKVLDCDRPGRACLTISCNLGFQAKDEATVIDVQMLLNTETLKKDSSSVIQFVTRSHVQVDSRAMEVSRGLPEDISLVFEALHSQEPRGYVVGWIIAISLLVGILIFLLLAVLLWKLEKKQMLMSVQVAFFFLILHITALDNTLFYNGMASLIDDSLIKTSLIKQVVAPIAAHICYLALLSETNGETVQFIQLEASARAVAKASRNMADVATRVMAESDDDVIRLEMGLLLEPLMMAGSCKAKLLKERDDVKVLSEDYLQAMEDCITDLLSQRSARVPVFSSLNPTLIYTSLFLKQEAERWDVHGNQIVKVTKEMAEKIYDMTQYLKRKGPIQ
ncbi:integrin alpha-9, partial [Clarias magur]